MSSYTGRQLGRAGLPAEVGPTPGTRVIGRIRITITQGPAGVEHYTSLKLPSRKVGVDAMRAALTKLEGFRDTGLVGPAGEAIEATGSLGGA